MSWYVKHAMIRRFVCVFFFFNDTATTEIYTLSLHDALPIYAPVRDAGQWPRGPRDRHRPARRGAAGRVRDRAQAAGQGAARSQDRKSTRLNSSHANISYAVFCLKKKNKQYSQ